MYSGGVAEWDGLSTPITEKRGWKGHIWMAVNTTLDEPDLSSINWGLDDPVGVGIVSFQEVHMPDDSPFLMSDIGMISFAEVHINKPPTADISVISFGVKRNAPYLIQRME